MAYSIYTTPLISPLLRLLATLMLKLTGWRIEADVPDLKKYVIVGAPHTSNWDYVIFLCAMLVLRVDIHVMVKDELYVFPFRTLMRWGGVVPVNRRESTTLAAQMVSLFNSRERLVLMITPEGTRKRVTRWRTGFYHIALDAGVPIVLAFVDYGRKAAGITKVVWPTGNIKQDLTEWQAIYEGFQGKNPKLQMPIPEPESRGTP